MPDVDTNNDLIHLYTAPGVPYYVKVTAYTIKGRGPYSDEVINFTEEDGKSQLPHLYYFMYVILQFHHKVLKLLTP